MKIKKGFVKRKIGDGYLVITTGALSKQTGIMIELNETASTIWDYIAKGYDENKIASALVKKYEITFDKALKDCQQLIQNMQEAGIFEQEEQI